MLWVFLLSSVFDKCIRSQTGLLTLNFPPIFLNSSSISKVDHMSARTHAKKNERVKIHANRRTRVSRCPSLYFYFSWPLFLVIRARTAQTVFVKHTTRININHFIVYGLWITVREREKKGNAMKVLRHLLTILTTLNMYATILISKLIGHIICEYDMMRLLCGSVLLIELKLSPWNYTHATKGDLERD